MTQNTVPQHVGIIMDGNGRWAKRRGLPRQAGHKAGAKAFRNIVKHCRQRKIPYLTVYAFSTENWKRPKAEVEAIMQLLEEYLDEAFAHEYEDKDVRVQVLGDISPLKPELQEKIKQIQDKSRDKTGLTVNIALNYGGRDELVHSMQALAQRVMEGRLQPEEITEGTIEQCLYTAGQPDPDLIIRPSGELRLSNFLIWQSAYAEFVFMNVLWPDFGPQELDQALKEFAGRNRRFGAV